MKKKVYLLELQLSNFKRIHGKYKLFLNKGLNILMPSYIPEENFKCSDMDIFAENIDAFFMNDFIEMIDILKDKNEFDLWDYSFFGDKNKSTSIKIKIKEDEKVREFIKKQEYRGKNVMGEIESYTKKHRMRILDMDKLEYDKQVVQKYLKDIVIYPKDFPILLKCIEEPQYLLKMIPSLNYDKFIKDTNRILKYYSICCSISNNKITIEPLPNKLYNKYNPYNTKHLEIALFIALQKQLKNNTIIFSQNFLSGLYEDDLQLALLMLLEFFYNKQQIILLYNNPYDISCHTYIYDFINYFNKKIDCKLYNLINFTEQHTLKKEWENRSIKIAARKLIARQELNYLKKKEISKNIIKEAILKCVSNYNNMAIGFSYGKDSLATTIIVKEVIDDLNKSLFKDKHIPYPTLVFSNTGVEFPETYNYKKEIDPILKKMGFKIEQTKPILRFKDVVEKYGFPMFGKAIRKNKNPKLYEKIKSLNIKCGGNMCCFYLKEEPTRIYYKTHNTELVFVGLLAEESYMRMNRWYALGDTYWNKGENLYKSQPLIHFSEDDIWRCIKESGLPYNSIYDKGYWAINTEGEDIFIKYKRSGCYCCSMNIQFNGNNIEMLRHTHPKLWDLIMNKLGLAKEIFKFKHSIKEEDWGKDTEYMLNTYLQSKPCHFDNTNWK